MFVQMLEASVLLLVILNPFLLVVYLIDGMQKLSRRDFRGVLWRAGLISAVVFCAFAWLGDAIFSDLLNAEFASFQIFGGVVFLLIGLQFVFQGPQAIQILQGDSQHLSGAVAMPILIGPGSISAAVVIGKRLEPLPAMGAVLFALTVSLAIIFLLKALHDWVRPRSEQLVERYIGIAGRITALYVGTISVDMIMQGARTWAEKF